jgi:chromosome segregation ATPase
MKHTTLRKTLGLTLLALLVWIPARAQQQNSQQSGTDDPVADAARKAQEKKKDAPKPKKVYTEDDINTKKSDISVVGPAPAQQDTTAAQANPGQANSEKAWRARFDALRTKIATAEQELNVLQREENKADVQYYSDPTKAMKEQYSREEINKKAAKIDAKQKEIAALKQQWDDLEDQLRKSHGDPGWAR